MRTPPSLLFNKRPIPTSNTKFLLWILPFWQTYENDHFLFWNIFSPAKQQGISVTVWITYTKRDITMILGFKEFSTMGSQAKSLSSRIINIVSLRYQVTNWMCWHFSLLKIPLIKFYSRQDKPLRNVPSLENAALVRPRFGPNNRSWASPWYIPHILHTDRKLLRNND